MSKYTTEVRFICEQKSGLSSSVGYNQVESVIEKSWDKIFGAFPIFDETYRKVLCKKILKYYYTMEICAETVGLWQLWLNNRMEVIMPYYNQLYLSQLLEFNPFYDVDLTRTHTRKTDGVHNEDSNGTRSLKSTSNSKAKQDKTDYNNETENEIKYDLYSDTPQGGITGLDSEKYLTNARKNVNTREVDQNSTSGIISNNDENYSDNEINSNNVNGSVNSTEEYLETVKGKQGGLDYPTLLQKYRSTFLNIDKLIIDELSDLFMLLW